MKRDLPPAPSLSPEEESLSQYPSPHCLSFSSYWSKLIYVHTLEKSLVKEKMMYQILQTTVQQLLEQGTVLPGKPRFC